MNTSSEKKAKVKNGKGNINDYMQKDDHLCSLLKKENLIPGYCFSPQILRKVKRIANTWCWEDLEKQTLSNTINGNC